MELHEVVSPVPDADRARARRLRMRVLVGGALALGVLALSQFVTRELRSSAMQARWLSGYARELQFELRPGPSEQIRFPAVGPFDERLGYTSIPDHVQRLVERDYVVTLQAHQSEALVEFADRGYFPPYRERTHAGLTVLDCRDDALYASRYPHRAYGAFDAVPPLVRATLAFIENRELLVRPEATYNPALDPVRLGRAVVDNALKSLDSDHAAGGGSTLATQIEKYRHSAEGRTNSALDKLRQIASASVRAYLDGEDTRAARQRILLDYVNTVPLGALRGWGEVHGLPDALHAWYGVDFQVASRALLVDNPSGADLEKQALAYRQVLSLMIAQRRPSHYLGAGRGELAELTDNHLRLLEQEGVIGPTLRDAALRTTVELRESYPATAAGDIGFTARKAANFARVQLSSMLDTPRLYDIDRLDLTVSTTIDGRLQAGVSSLLRRLREPQAAKEAGLVGDKLLERGNPAQLNYSFTLFERGDGVNRVRVHADNLDQPFDVNAGAKLELGSTAKLRTLVTYLELVAALHERLAPLSRSELSALPVAGKDRLTRWAVEHLSTAKDKSLSAMLDAAMQRRYSASPGEAFFTGGGLHRFENYDRKDDGRMPTMAEAFRDSVNLPFIRLMRDIVQHHIHRGPESAGSVLEQEDHPQRAVLLARFADREGSQFTRGFYRRHAGKTVEEMLDTLAGTRASPQRLAVIHRTLLPDAGFEAFDAFVAERLPALPETARRRLYEAHAPGRYSLSDRGYLARVHPLELAVAVYLREQPRSTLAQVLAATAAQRQEAYAWLMRTKAKGAQDARIRSLLEIDAFEHIHHAWRRVGYPFDSLVPSYATSIGSSGDRPAALAELIGIVLNDGMRLPAVQLDTLRFAEGTPYETVLRKAAVGGERVLAPEVAATLKRALSLVVEAGTARRLRGALLDDKGKPLPVGGKTGTGDNRINSYGPNAELVASRVLNRTATFVFYLGDRHFGTLTAFVPGAEVEQYRFTSALPVQILKTMAPLLAPVVAGPPDGRCTVQAPGLFGPDLGPPALGPVAARPLPTAATLAPRAR
jgi:membrane peptidoglycan carboxypeptidase